MILLRCSNLSLGYDGNVIAEGIDLEVHEGDFLTVIGENGTGKSTLIKSVLGLLPVLGGSIERVGLTSSGTGYLPQQTSFQKDFPASVTEVVLSAFQGKCGMRPFYNKEEKFLAKEALERMGIADLAKRCYRELSGGQQQRVLLARAVIASGRLLVLDEPVTGLDPKAAEEMYALINELNRRDGMSIIMISHDISAAMKYSTHILKLGEKVFFGTKDEYIREGRKI